MKNISILGSTGSIGTQTLDIVRKSDNLNIVALSANKNYKKLYKQILEFNPDIVCLYDTDSANILRKKLKQKDIKIDVYEGIDGLIKVATFSGIDLLVTSVVGMIGLIPTVEAIKNKIDIALANKETLVTAGNIITSLAKKNNVKILPVDSEHSAIFQCLQGENEKNIKKLILTGSGGAFRDYNKEQIQGLKSIYALKHPNWSMGDKITIDSATLMNKGLEVIEASYLFDIQYDKIEVLIHRQSIIHSMVEFNDNSVKAQLAVPDMRGPISYALFYPERNNNFMEEIELTSKKLTFEKPDLNTFPCLDIAYKALKKGGSAPTVLNSSNEEAVKLYLQDKITFYDISKIVKNSILNHNFIPNPSIDEILNLDKKIRENIKKIEF